MGNAFGMKCMGLALSLCLFSPLAHAASTMCAVPETTAHIKGIGWDDQKLTAKVVFLAGTSFDGTVTLVSPHNPNGVKTNIFVKYPKPQYGYDATEFIVFSTGAEFRVIGVNYVFRRNKYHLSSLSGNYVAKCLSL